MLSEHLRELENDELLVRYQFDDKLQRVEYGLSNKGKSLMPVLNQLQDWGINNIPNVLSIQEMLNVTMD